MAATAVEERIGSLSEQVRAHDQRHSRAIASIEDRLRDVELWRARLGGIMAVSSAAGGIGGALLAAWLMKAIGLHS